MRIPRAIRFWWQRRTRGWDDSDTWNLDVAIAKFILPRLKRFKEMNGVYPPNLTEKEWDTGLDMMIDAFEIASSENWYFMTNEESGQFKLGFEVFNKYYIYLWW